MDFRDYQKLSRKTAIYPQKGKNFIYPTLGLVGEAGEVAEKIKKVLRDNQGIIDQPKKGLLWRLLTIQIAWLIGRGRILLSA